MHWTKIFPYSFTFSYTSSVSMPTVFFLLPVTFFLNRHLSKKLSFIFLEVCIIFVARFSFLRELQECRLKIVWRIQTAVTEKKNQKATIQFQPSIKPETLA